jgi:glycosyltransferase involved in cell wall biosynthesis
VRRDTLADVRALVVTNMYPSAADPARGSFVHDQVEALRALEGVEVEVHAFPLGGARAYLRAGRALRRSRRGERFDVVHAHFGLAAWPALAARGARHAVTLHGTDLHHPRSGPISRAALRWLDLAATVSASLARRVPGAGRERRVAVLPCGVDLERFRPLPRAEARARLGLDPDEPCVLFPADPARPEKRHDRALAAAAGARVHALGAVAPDQVPLWVNAANAVLVPSEREGFGLATLEALACDVPVLATPVGVAPLALAGVAGTLCAPWDAEGWRAALAGPLSDPDPRVEGRARAALFSSRRMAERVAAAWSELV